MNQPAKKLRLSSIGPRVSSWIVGFRAARELSHELHLHRAEAFILLYEVAHAGQVDLSLATCSYILLYIT